ncbi:MAG: M23 family metallopeptidase [Bacteroidales bacterium]|nr:M23 family metallopeptidase [Bacteroidales bacterium]
MSAYKYHFDPETLIYSKVKLDFKTRVYKKFLPKFAISAIIGVIIFVLSSFIIKSPIEKQLEEEKSALILKFDMLNRQMAEAEGSLDEVENRDDNIYRKIFQANPIPQSVRKAGFGGVDKYKIYEGSENLNILKSTAKRLDILSKQLVVQSKSFDEVIDLVKDKEKMLASIPAIQPIALNELTRFGSAFGYRIHPIYKILKMHTGIDLTAPRGTEIHASGNGIVTRADWAGGYGNCVRINHGYGYMTLYGHMNKFIVRPGQKVKRGDVIGYVGSTGLSTSPHLHYEVRINGKFVNPVNFYYNDLTDEEYAEMIEMSSNANTHIFE